MDTLHLFGLAKLIWLAQQPTLRRIMISLAVLLGMVLAQGTRLCVGATSDRAASGSAGGVWLEASVYSTHPERPEPWLRASFYSENDGQFLFVSPSGWVLRVMPPPITL
jgi:hypothetical protein